jgi:hypothetical protein
MRKFTREQGHTTKTPEIIGQQHDGDIEGQQIPGDTAATPAFPSISSRDTSNCFVFQVKSADFDKGTRILDDLSFGSTKLHS